MPAPRPQQPGSGRVTVSVLIADDHPVVREGLRHILASQPSIAVAGEAADGDQLVSQLAATPVDLVLLDITMPGSPFPTLLKLLRARHPQVRALVLSMQPEDQFALRALRQGAAGYLTKERSPQDLLHAIRTIMRGGKYVPPSLAQYIATSLDPEEPPSGTEALSEREYQVLRLIGAGKRVREIAAELGLSPKTVSTYRTRILQKLRLRTTAELIRYALQHQLAS